MTIAAELCNHARLDSLFALFAMFHVILYQPEIPPNTGNLIRLCANAGATLHLVHPLGFALDEPRVRRAGLEYHEMACVQEHADFAACLAALRRRACSR
jgi:tRNA (cytidine/uridine-2'-O-)-methyltransferase